MSIRRLSGAGHIGAIVATTVTVALAAFLFFNRQWAIDQLSVWQYDPSGAVSTLATRSGMNSEGRFLFYASQPSIDTAQAFNDACGSSHEVNTAILGCYAGHKIYVYNVTNQQLDGVKSVTAAHEMLHAAYERMSGSERSQVNKLVEAEYNKLKSNKEFEERMSFYAKTEPGERDNELHSILGTEVGDLSSALEQHYRKYFSDRQKVVHLYDNYSAVFTKLKDQSDQLVSQMNNLSDSIESRAQQYNRDVAQLSSDIQDFNSKAKNGGFSSQAQFDNERAALVARTSALDDERQSINDDIQEYKQLRSQLAQIASQSEALNRSINSNLSPAPSV